MHRVFALDVLACPRCGGRLRVIAIVQDPAIVRTILAHGGRALSTEAPGPPRPRSGRLPARHQTLALIVPVRSNARRIRSWYHADAAAVSG